MNRIEIIRTRHAARRETLIELQEIPYAFESIHFFKKNRAMGHVNVYARALCTNCLSSNTEWVKCKGTGKIYTFTVTNQNGSAGFRESLPYVMAYVELAEGLKVLTNLVECKPDEVRIGMPVEAVFEDATPEVTLLKFRPAR